MALPDDADSVGHSFHLGEGVTREEHRASILGDLAHHCPKLVLHERVEARVWFIEDDELGPVHECGNEADLLSIACGELPHPLVEICAEPLGELGGKGPGGIGVSASSQSTEKLEGLSPRHVWPEGKISGKISELSPHAHIGRGLAEHERTASARPQLPHERANEGRLPGPVGAQKAEHLTR